MPRWLYTTFDCIRPIASAEDNLSLSRGFLLKLSFSPLAFKSLLQ